MPKNKYFPEASPYFIINRKERKGTIKIESNRTRMARIRRICADCHCEECAERMTKQPGHPCSIFLRLINYLNPKRYEVHITYK